MVVVRPVAGNEAVGRACAAAEALQDSVPLEPVEGAIDSREPQARRLLTRRVEELDRAEGAALCPDGLEQGRALWSLASPWHGRGV